MTRISENSTAITMLRDMLKNRSEVNKYSEEISSGLKVQDPGDSKHAGTISGMQNTLKRIKEDKLRVSEVTGFLTHQDNSLAEVNEILVRATEVATQAGNESNSENERLALASEVFEIREHLINLSNSTYQGRHIFSGGTDNTPAYSPDTATPFTTPATTGISNTFYRYDTADGSGETRDVQVTTDLQVTLNTPANNVFQDALDGLTELGRSLQGYRTVYTTTGVPPVRVPDNTASTAYVFPDDFKEQSQDIRAALDKIGDARSLQIQPERTNVAGRLRRLQTAESLLDLSETSASTILNDFQSADVIESATMLTEAQTALNASLTVTTQILRQSILDYL